MTRAHTFDGPGRVLLVEDDVDQRELVAEILRWGHYDVEIAGTAAAYAVAAAHEPELILLDIGLPDEDGLQLCLRLKAVAALRDCPILFLTVAGSSDSIIQGFTVGASDFLVKPVQPDILLARVGTHWRLGRLTHSLRADADHACAQRKRLLRRLRELHAQAALTEQRQLRELAQRLHDAPLQQLALAKTLLDVVYKNCQGLGLGLGLGPASPAGTRATTQLARAIELLGQTSEQLRRLCFDLGAPLLDQLGLCGAVQALVQQLADAWGLRYRVDCRGSDGGLDEAIRVICHQAVRELLNNVGKHACAGLVELDLRIEPRRILLLVRDDGVGLPAEGPAPSEGPKGGGFGLLSLRSRIGLLGGSLRLRGLSPSGTEARLLIPLPVPGRPTEDMAEGAVARRPTDGGEP